MDMAWTTFKVSEKANTQPLPEACSAMVVRARPAAEDV